MELYWGFTEAQDLSPSLMECEGTKTHRNLEELPCEPGFASQWPRAPEEPRQVLERSPPYTVIHLSLSRLKWKSLPLASPFGRHKQSNGCRWLWTKGTQENPSMGDLSEAV